MSNYLLLNWFFILVRQLISRKWICFGNLLRARASSENLCCVSY